MDTMNETIRLNTKRDGLEIDFSRIKYGDVPNDPKTAPSWATFHFSASELAQGVKGATITRQGNGRTFVTFTEDQVEEYLNEWLDRHFKHSVTSFRWIWGKYTIYNNHKYMADCEDTEI